MNTLSANEGFPWQSRTFYSRPELSNTFSSFFGTQQGRDKALLKFGNPNDETGFSSLTAGISEYHYYIDYLCSTVLHIKSGVFFFISLHVAGGVISYIFRAVTVNTPRLKPAHLHIVVSPSGG